tara:strand:- start:259 stop:1440 length:1182 start_codon:yes stop_codon:yes gene_type:complete
MLNDALCFTPPECIPYKPKHTKRTNSIIKLFYMGDRLSPLDICHEQQGAKFTTFGGWKMPIRFGSIVEEHHHVRKSVGKFDVSHMGQILVEGKDAECLTNKLVSNNVSRLKDNQAQYSMVTNSNGIILDDVLIYRNSSDSFMFVPNAGHDQEMTSRWVYHRDEWDLDATITNSTNDNAMFAIQGPHATDYLDKLSENSVSVLKKFHTLNTTIAGIDCNISRTGYTGEDGFEIILDCADAISMWQTLDMPSCGLASRDTLRTEMGFLLSGQDFNPKSTPRNPFEAGVGFTVDLSKDFIGGPALKKIESEQNKIKFIGLISEVKSIPRSGSDILNNDGKQIGIVTSGTLSPTLNIPIGLGYISSQYASPGTSVKISTRDKTKPAKISKTPFINPQ